VRNKAWRFKASKDFGMEQNMEEIRYNRTGE
jgi:hypothetical protein